MKKLLNARECSGCVVIKNRGDKGHKVLLVRATRSGRWVFPKGGIETNLSPQASALKEVYEEAGVLGRIDLHLGTYKVKRRGQVHNVTMYRMHSDVQLDRYPEQKIRQRKFFTVEGAAQVLDKVSVEFLFRALDA